MYHTTSAPQHKETDTIARRVHLYRKRVPAQWEKTAKARHASLYHKRVTAQDKNKNKAPRAICDDDDGDVLTIYIPGIVFQENQPASTKKRLQSVPMVYKQTHNNTCTAAPARRDTVHCRPCHTIPNLFPKTKNNTQKYPWHILQSIPGTFTSASQKYKGTKKNTSPTRQGTTRRMTRHDTRRKR